MQHFFCHWEVACRFQFNNSPFFPATDESHCRNVANIFSSNAQYWVRYRLILSFFHSFIACIHINSSFQVAFFPVDKNQKSWFQKPWFCAFWKKLFIFAYFSTFLYNVVRIISILTYIYSICMFSWFSKAEKRFWKFFF